MHTHHSKQFGSLFSILMLVFTILGVPASPVRAGAPTSASFTVDAYSLPITTTARVSVDSNGAQGNDSSSSPFISVDGRNVVFESSASTLVSGDIKGTVDIFIATAAMSLSIIKTGTGSGTVTSSPAGITCGAVCSSSFPNNSVVALTASPSAGSIFSGWSGGGCSGTGSCTVTITAATSVLANFTLGTSYTLSIIKTGTGSGTVTSSPAGITCGAVCSSAFTYNTVVTLTASPTSLSTFGGWSGAGCSSTGTCIVIMDTVKSVTANFTQFTYIIRIYLPLVIR
jgi:hypothetical protein